MITTDRLAALDARIELLVVDPDAVRAPWVRLARPILSRLGYQAEVKIVGSQALLAEVRSLGDREVTMDEQARLMTALKVAIDELEINLRSVERVCVLQKKAQVAHAAWLRQLSRAIRAAREAVDHLDQPELRRIAGAIEPVALLPPLSIKRLETGGTAEGESDEEAQGDPHARRVLELQLGSIDHLLAAARDESDVLSRRRRLLEAARRMLVESAAALPIDPTGMEARRRYIAREIARLDRVQAAGVAPDVALIHQARGAVSRGEADRLAAILSVLDEAALARGDAKRAGHTGAAMRALFGNGARSSREMLERSRAISAREMYGREALDAVARGYKQARAFYAHNQPGATEEDRDFRQTAANYVAGGAESQLMTSALMTDGCFEVGGALAPVRVEEEQRRLEAVKYPTQNLVLAPAQGIADVPDAIISDPRSILMDLAAGRLLARRFVHERIERKTRTVMRGEVRVYLLDGSGSMVGPRARLRDAIIVTELATLARRLQQFGKAARVVLYYRFFSESLGPVARVDSHKTAIAGIEDIVSMVRRGGTDIQLALLASLAQVKEARAIEPDLARAQIVLVTDGESPVDEAAITAAREELGDLRVGISVIALGQENTALRDLVARQRGRGEPAFYHHIPDEAIVQMASGELDDGPAIHLPMGAFGAKTMTERASLLRDAVGTLVEDLASLGKQHDVEALEALDLESRARHELGLADEIDLSEGERAKTEALQRDRRALERRYARWFPAIDALVTAPRIEEPKSSDADADAVVVALSTVAEVVEVVGGSELSRRADAIEVLERLLPDAHLSLASYEAVLRERPDRVKAALDAVHHVVAPVRSAA